jgi:hypothetical protein
MSQQAQQPEDAKPRARREAPSPLPMELAADWGEVCDRIRRQVAERNRVTDERLLCVRERLEQLRAGRRVEGDGRRRGEDDVTAAT